MVLLVNDALPAVEGLEAESLDRLSAASILQGVDAVSVSRLPLIWQQMAAGNVNVGHRDPSFLVAIARLFYTKATDRSAEVFQSDGFQQSVDFQSFYEKGARETLEFFGHDFIQS